MKSHPVRVLLAFAVVYIVWGSTYLAIRTVVETLPPALSAGLRFIVAGSLMLIYSLLRGGTLPRTGRDWLRIALVGTSMLAAGNGLVTWSEKWVASNQAALIVATSALWMAWMGALGSRGDRVGPLMIVGLLAGFGGVVMLVGGGLSAHLAPWPAYAGLLLAPIFWALGSVYSKRAPVAVAPEMSAALQMLVAGVVLTPIGLALGQGAELHGSLRSWLALAYLVVLGSCLAYGVFVWLVHEVSPALLGTYAYVNPAIAALLGWWILDEQFSQSQIAGTLIILASVAPVTLGNAKSANARR